MTRRKLAPLLVLLCFVAPGCRTVATVDEVRERLSPGSILLPVPNVPDEENGSCGLDCVISLLRFHGLELDDEGRRRFPLAEVQKEWISAGELRDYLIVRGFRAHLVHGTLDSSQPAGILHLLRCGLPVIVEREIDGSNHFNLVCGFEPERRWVFVMAPEGVGVISYDRFEQSWARVDRLMLAAAPGATIVPTEPAVDAR